eukprot:TRINITY_DN49_c0_g1_i1.p1 TRINITY_DN49_c0_g1~~TRINITY_DN49_c0_g1_i1.p1  ORF type:complete len:236 (-),score=40.33 TRINITY_DN49_c0_g1_i1:213-920(-)
MKRLVNAEPRLINVQPCGRDGTPRWAALHQAAFGGSVDAVQFLLEHGADVNAKTKDGQVPLDVSKKEPVRVLLRKASAQARPPMLRKSSSDLIPTPIRSSVASTAAFVPPSCDSSGRLGKKKAKSAQSKVVGRKAMKAASKSKVAKGKRGKALVYKGSFEKTVGGLTKCQLARSKTGKIVSKKMQARGNAAYAHIKCWVESMVKARAELGLSGFVAVRKGSPLYAKTMDIYRSCK